MKGEYELVDMIRPDSGCKLAKECGFVIFEGIWDQTGGNPCDYCAHNHTSHAPDGVSFATEACEFLKKEAAKEKQTRVANFGKHSHETNAEIATRLGVSKRQVAKMRKKGEL